MRTLKIITLLLIIPAVLNAQSDILNSYVKQGLDNNESIHEQNFELKKSLYALKEATGMFFPNIGLDASYTDAHGGRTIDVPVGQLVNPIYSNLNTINHQLNPASPTYPMLGDYQEQLLPTNFYDAYFTASLPIINAEIWYNHRIKKDQVQIQRDEVDIYKRELVRDIKTAYFNYLKATRAKTIYENALTIVKESERVNQKLVDNGKEVIYALSRSKSEVSKIEAQLNDAVYTEKNAAAYFNFLLNRPTDSEIITDDALLNNLLPLPDNLSLSTTGREELNKLLVARHIDQSVLSLNQGSWIPKVGAQFNLGSQASDFAFNSQSRYYLLGVSFAWDLFTGLRDVNRIKQSHLEMDALASKTKYVQSQLELAAITSANSYTSAKQQFKSAADEENSAQEYFNLENKKYKEGQALYIEFLDARNESTFSSLQKSLRYFDAWIKYTDLERANASFNIQQP